MSVEVFTSHSMSNPVFGTSLVATTLAAATSSELSARDASPDALRRSSPCATIIELTAENFEAVLWKELHSKPELVATKFPVDAPPIFRMLDSEFRTQVFADAIRVAKESLAKTAPLTPADLETARAGIHSWAELNRHGLHDLWTACKDRSLITMFGTSNKDFWNERLERFLNILAEKSVEHGVSNINGGAIHGLMGRATDAFKAAIEQWNEEHPDNKTTASVILVLLSIYSTESPEPPAEALESRLRSHPMATFMTRTRLMFALAPGGCSLIFPGGLGTLEEAGVAEADEQIGKRVIADSISQTTHVGFVNALIDVPDPVHGGETRVPFWDGMRRFHERMHRLGTLKTSVNATIGFYQPGHDYMADDSIADLIVQTCRSCESKHASPMDPTEKRIRERTQAALDAHRTFNMSSYGPDAPPYYHFLDAQYAGQVRLETEALAIDTVCGMNDHAFEDTVIDEAVESAVKKAVHWRGQLRRLMDELQNDKTITVSGLAKDDIVAKDPAMLEYARELARNAVANGVTIIIQGDGKEGIAKAIGDAWAAAKATHPESASKLVRLQLQIQNEMAPGRKWDREGNPITEERAVALRAAGEQIISERLGPPMASNLVRSHAALCLGDVQEIVIFPCDSVGFSFAAEALLARQLSEVTLTPFTGKTRPVTTFVNAKFGDPEGFFDGFRDQLDMFIACKTAKPKHIDGVRFVTP